MVTLDRQGSDSLSLSLMLRLVTDFYRLCDKVETCRCRFLSDTQIYLLSRFQISKAYICTHKL